VWVWGAMGRAEQAVGERDLRGLEVAELERALADGRALRVVTPHLRRLLDAGSTLLSVRAALRAGDWPALQAVLAGPGPGPGPGAGAGAKPGPAPHGQGAGALAAAEAEVALAQAELTNQQALQALRAALARGGIDAAGPLGAKEPALVSGAEAQAALAQWDKHAGRGLSRLACRYLEAARLVARLRAHCGKTPPDWDAVRAVLTTGERAASASADGLVPEVQAEYRAAFDECHDWHFARELARLLQEGQVTGVAGGASLAGARLGDLEAKIRMVAAWERPLSEATRALLKAAQLVRGLREKALAGAWLEVDALCLAYHDGNLRRLPDLARGEALLIREEATHRRVVGALEAALAAGRPSGQVGELELAGVAEGMAALQASIDLATAWDPARRTALADAYLTLAKCLLRFRAALLAHLAEADPDPVAALDERQLQEVLDSGAAGPDGRPLEGRAELALALHEVRNRKALHALVAALGSGGIATFTGSLAEGVGAGAGAGADLGISTVELSQALEVAHALEVKSRAVRQLLAVGRRVAALRQAVAAGDWARVPAALDQAHASLAANPNPNTAAAGGEVAATEAECHHMWACQDLRKAAAAGGVEAVASALVTWRLRTDGLRRAIAYAQAWIPRCATPALTELLQAAETLLLLRGRVMAGDWEATGEALAGLLALEPGGAVVAGAGLWAGAHEEVGLMRDAWLQHRVRKDLLAAMAAGPIGRADGDGPALDTSRLDLGVGALQAATGLAHAVRAAAGQGGCVCAAAVDEDLLLGADLLLAVRKLVRANVWGRLTLAALADPPPPALVQAVGRLDLAGLVSVELAVKAARALGGCLLDCPAHLHGELALVRARLVDMAIISDLTACLGLGLADPAPTATGPSPGPGPGVAALDAVLALLPSHGDQDQAASSGEARRLMQTARVVRQLRALGGKGDWDAVRALLAAPLTPPLHEVALPEVQLLQRHVAGRAALEQARGQILQCQSLGALQALRPGLVAGVDGQAPPAEMVEVVQARAALTAPEALALATAADPPPPRPLPLLEAHLDTLVARSALETSLAALADAVQAGKPSREEVGKRPPPSHPAMNPALM
jgi:hypothetical protein